MKSRKMNKVEKERLKLYFDDMISILPDLKGKIYYTRSLSERYTLKIHVIDEQLYKNEKGKKE